jgi:hypothetical protein
MKVLNPASFVLRERNSRQKLLFVQIVQLVNIKNKILWHPRCVKPVLLVQSGQQLQPLVQHVQTLELDNYKFLQGFMKSLRALAR